jgi:hypothetical protein
MLDGPLFSFQKVLQNLSHSPSHQILRHMHEALNIDKKNLLGETPSWQGRRRVALGQPVSLVRHPWSSNQEMNNMGLEKRVKWLE